MFQANAQLIHETYSHLGNVGQDARTGQALGLYRLAQGRAWFGRLWSRLTGRSNRLRDLETSADASVVRSRRSGGIQSVPISQIGGSLSRKGDFDAAFNPLQGHTRDRWIGVASAWLRGTVLPPVDLIQVGGTYFVKDGHHRISVARALGQKAIDAEVTVWELA